MLPDPRQPARPCRGARSRCQCRACRQEVGPGDCLQVPVLRLSRAERQDVPHREPEQDDSRRLKRGPGWT